MKTARVIVRFAHGLHARPAARLVTLFKRFQSSVLFRAGTSVANAGSLLSLLLLKAAPNTQLEVQASGEDEEEAIRAVEHFFQGEEEGFVPGSRTEPAQPAQTHVPS